MKLLQINTFVNSGSTGRIAEDIGKMVISNGWKSFIAYGRNSRQSESHLVKIGHTYDTYMHGVKTRVFDKHGLGSSRATKRLIRNIIAIDPDIIHLHNIHGYYINIKLLFKYLKKANKPVVWTFHDCWPITGHCVHFEYSGCDKWKSECSKCPEKKTYPASILMDQSKKTIY